MDLKNLTYDELIELYTTLKDVLDTLAATKEGFKND